MSNCCDLDTRVCADLVKANDVEKSLRIVVSFGGVNQKNFWSALEERLEPAMKKVCCHKMSAGYICIRQAKHRQ